MNLAKLTTDGDDIIIKMGSWTTLTQIYCQIKKIVKLLISFS
jgi:hypothetical protein